MSRFLKSVILLLTLVSPFGFAAGAAHAEKRIALVIGNAGYQAGALNTPSNDAGLIAQTLQASGFDVVGARGSRLAKTRFSRFSRQSFGLRAGHGRLYLPRWLWIAA